jgi:Trk-type K+ transport system membrane component
MLSYMGIALGASMVLPLLVAILANEQQQILAFSLTGLLTLVMAITILLLTGTPARPARVNDALAVAVLWCFGAPIPSALPFVFGTAEPSFIAGLHEAVACLTTTGHSVIDMAGNAWPESLLVWRGVLHFIGMMFSLTIAATVFAALGFAGPGIHKSYLFTVPEGNFFDAIPRAVRAIFIICATIILSVFSVLISNGIEIGEALSIAISVASTGLVSPDGYAGFSGTAVIKTAIFIALFLATAGLSILMSIRPKQLRYAKIDPELYLLIGLIVFMAFLNFSGGMASLASIGWALSSLSTSGLPLGVSISEARSTLPLGVLVLPALIGGAALSTAGGIKLARIIILMRRAGQEFARLGFQNSVVALEFRQRQQKETAVLGVWVYLIAYIAAVSGVFSVLSFLNIDFSDAIAQATGAISNSGWLITPDAGAGGIYHLTLVVAMILGRLEILALLPMLNPGFWSR